MCVTLQCLLQHCFYHLLRIVYGLLPFFITAFCLFIITAFCLFIITAFAFLLFYGMHFYIFPCSIIDIRNF